MMLSDLLKFDHSFGKQQRSGARNRARVPRTKGAWSQPRPGDYQSFGFELICSEQLAARAEQAYELDL